MMMNFRNVVKRPGVRQRAEGRLGSDRFGSTLASLRAAFLRKRPFNVPQPPPVVEPPLQLPLSVALAHLTSISF